MSGRAELAEEHETMCAIHSWLCDRHREVHAEFMACPFWKIWKWARLIQDANSISNLAHMAYKQAHSAFERYMESAANVKGRGSGRGGQGGLAAPTY